MSGLNEQWHRFTLYILAGKALKDLSRVTHLATFSTTNLDKLQPRKCSGISDPIPPGNASFKCGQFNERSESKAASTTAAVL